MQVPIELIVYLLGLIVAGLGAFLSFAIHLLIKLNGNITDIKNDQAIIGIRLTTLEKEREVA